MRPAAKPVHAPRMQVSIIEANRKSRAGSGEGRAHRLREFGNVQAPGRRADAELMHPVIGRRRFLLPACSTAEEQEGVPGGLVRGAVKAEDGPVGGGDGVAGVEVVMDARVVKSARGGARRAREGLGAQAAEYAEPDDVDAKVGLGIGFENGAVDFGDPPKAGASSGIHEKQQANAAGVAVEGGAQRLAVLRQRGKSGWLFRRYRQESGEGQQNHHASGE